MTRLEIPFDEKELEALKALADPEHPDDPVAAVKSIVRERIALEEAREQELKTLLRERQASMRRGEGKPVDQAFWDRLDRTIEEAAARNKS